MKISKKQLSLIIENYLLTEAVHDKVAAQLGITDPDKIEQLRVASEKPHKLQKPELLWIGQYFTTPEGMQTKEPIVDIVAAIKSLKQNKAALMRRGSSANLSDYESPGQINIAVSLSRGFVDISQLSEQVDVLYEDDNWTLYMPHSREASCTIGRGTTWCTAIPGAGNNLFYNYVIGGRAILYYLVKKKKEENESPATTHFSLGTIGGRIPFPEEGKGHGHIVVDGNNRGLSKTRFLSTVGEQLGSQIISTIELHSKQNRNSHPAKNKVIEMLKNPALYIVEMRGKSIDIRYDFTAMMVSTYASIFNPQSESEESRLIADVFTDPSNLFNKAIVASTEIKQKDILTYENAIQTKNNDMIQKYGKIFGDGGTIKNAEYEIRIRTKDSAGLDISGVSGYRFCKNLDKLSGSVPFYMYKLVEKLGEDIASGWEGEESVDFYTDFNVIDSHDNVIDYVRSTLEEDPALSNITGELDKHYSNFMTMLEIYYVNILTVNGYCLVHDPQEFSHQRDEFAGFPVGYLDSYMSTSETEMYWAGDDYHNYESGTAFTSNEIQNYMQNNLPQEFIDWCNTYGFTFTYE